MPPDKGVLGLQPVICRRCQANILIPVIVLLDGLPCECPHCRYAVPAIEIEQSDPALHRVLRALREVSKVKASLPLATTAQHARYRFLLLDANGEIGAKESFLAESDQTAKEIAASVSEACADVFHGYQLWRRKTCLATIRHERASKGVLLLSDMMRARQSNILDLEDRLQRSSDCLGKSKRLLATTAALRAV